MRTNSVSIDINASEETIFDLVHDYTRRLDWDPFLREARILEGATRADAGVKTRCAARWTCGGLAMETDYISFRRPRVAAVKMTRGPWFFRSFAASIRSHSVKNGVTRVTYRYHFELRPTWLAFVIEPVVHAVLRRETRLRLAALKEHLEAGD